jgi:hypothetical protein
MKKSAFFACVIGVGLTQGGTCWGQGFLNPFGGIVLGGGGSQYNGQQIQQDNCTSIAQALQIENHYQRYGYQIGGWCLTLAAHGRLQNTCNNARTYSQLETCRYTAEMQLKGSPFYSECIQRLGQGASFCSAMVNEKRAFASGAAENPTYKAGVQEQARSIIERNLGQRSSPQLYYYPTPSGAGQISPVPGGMPLPR